MSAVLKSAIINWYPAYMLLRKAILGDRIFTWICLLPMLNTESSVALFGSIVVAPITFPSRSYFMHMCMRTYIMYMLHVYKILKKY